MSNDALKEYDVVVDGVSVGYAADDRMEVVLEDISFKVRRGAFVTILGPSGCGKSSLLRCIAGVLKPLGGEVRLSGDCVKSGVGFLQQTPSLLPWRNVFANATYALELRGVISRDSCEGAMRLITEYELDAHLDKMPQELSGGMRQRLSIIRTLAAQPKLILGDEPFAAIDHIARLDLAYRFRKDCVTRDIGNVLVTHSLEEAIFLSDEIIVLGGRPARIVDHVVDVELKRAAEDAVACRNTPEFQSYFVRLWKALGAGRALVA